jgi:hypothetical protein
MLCGAGQGKDTLELYDASKLLMHGKCVAIPGLHRPLNSIVLWETLTELVPQCGLPGAYLLP